MVLEIRRCWLQLRLLQFGLDWIARTIVVNRPAALFDVSESKYVPEQRRSSLRIEDYEEFARRRLIPSAIDGTCDLRFRQRSRIGLGFQS